MNSKDAVGQVYGPRVATKSCNVCALCAVCLGGMYRRYFCGGLSMVLAVNVGDIWELPRLSCRRWHTFGIYQEAGGGGVEARPPRDDNFKSTTHLLRRGQERGRCGGGAPAQGRAE